MNADGTTQYQQEIAGGGIYIGIEKEASKASDSTAVTTAAKTSTGTTQPFLYDSPNKGTAPNHEGNLLKSPKHLTSLLSSPLFPTAPSSVIGRSNHDHCIANDDTKKDTRLMQNMNNDTNTKHRPARVSIGNKVTGMDMMEIEENPRGGDIASLTNDLEHEHACEEEPSRKKRKQDGAYNDEENSPVLDNQVQNDPTVVWEDVADASAPMLLEDEEDENPYADTIRKIDKWSKELLALKRKLDNARLKNAVLLNRMYEIGAIRVELSEEAELSEDIGAELSED